MKHAMILLAGLGFSFSTLASNEDAAYEALREKKLVAKKAEESDLKTLAAMKDAELTKELARRTGRVLYSCGLDAAKLAKEAIAKKKLLSIENTASPACNSAKSALNLAVDVAVNERSVTEDRPIVFKATVQYPHVIQSGTMKSEGPKSCVHYLEQIFTNWAKQPTFPPYGRMVAPGSREEISYLEYDSLFASTIKGTAWADGAAWSQPLGIELFTNENQTSNSEMVLNYNWSLRLAAGKSNGTLTVFGSYIDSSTVKDKKITPEHCKVSAPVNVGMSSFR